MAAKRFGEILSSITGTAGQVLRINSGETGFEFATPATIPAYTITNKTVDRVFDADDITLDEVADVLATLIDDLATLGSAGVGAQTRYISENISVTSNSFNCNVTHGLGSEPDAVFVQYLNSGAWVQFYSWVNDGGTQRGWRCTTSTTATTVYLDIFGMNGTTIRVLCFKLGIVAQINPFQWSTSEQVWPFEKDSSGNTLYCKEINIGQLANAGSVSVAHNISNWTSCTLHDFKVIVKDTSTAGLWWPQTYNEGGSYKLHFWINSTSVVASCYDNWTTSTAKARLIYAK